MIFFCLTTNSRSRQLIIKSRMESFVLNVNSFAGGQNVDMNSLGLSISFIIFRIWTLFHPFLLGLRTAGQKTKKWEYTTNVFEIFLNLLGFIHSTWLNFFFYLWLIILGLFHSVKNHQYFSFDEGLESQKTIVYTYE